MCHLTMGYVLRSAIGDFAMWTSQCTWYSLLLSRYKLVKHVTVGNCGTVVFVYLNISECRKGTVHIFHLLMILQDHRRRTGPLLMEISLCSSNCNTFHLVLSENHSLARRGGSYLTSLRANPQVKW